MEYIDNAIDDREMRFREDRAYSTPLEVVVDLYLSPEAKLPRKKKGRPKGKRRSKSAESSEPWFATEIAVRDNCGGMDRESLERLVRFIGESNKASTSWLNGQFGFGVHAFRAAADTLTVTTKHASSDLTHTLSIDRADMSFSPAVATAEPVLSHASPCAARTGTKVLLEGIDPQWADGLTSETMASEVEHHFERLLTRPGLSVSVREFRKSGPEDEPELVKTVVCTPFDYDSIEGADFSREIILDDDEGEASPGGDPARFNIRLKVAEREYEGQRARAFLLGRRIADIGNIQSFIKASQYKAQLWSHPQLLGYIEIDGAAVQPVITRDEFKQNEARQNLYDALVDLEPQLWDALNDEMDRQRVITFEVIETVLSRALQKVVTGDKRTLMPQLGHVEKEVTVKKSVDDKSKPKSTKPRAPAKPSFNIQLANVPDTADGVKRRMLMVGNQITINVNHPEFQGRIATRRGRVQFTDRLGGYLANVIAAAYKDYFYDENDKNPARGQVYDDLLGDASKLEQIFRGRMPMLQRELNKIGTGEGVDSDAIDPPQAEDAEESEMIDA